MNNQQPPIEVSNPFQKIIEDISELKRMFSTLIIEQAKKTDYPEDELLDTEACASYLKLSVPTIYRLCSNNELPCYKKGRKILFSKDELTAWVKDSRT